MFGCHIGHAGELHGHDFAFVVFIGAVVLSLAWRAFHKQ